MSPNSNETSNENNSLGYVSSGCNSFFGFALVYSVSVPGILGIKSNRSSVLLFFGVHVIKIIVFYIQY